MCAVAVIASLIVLGDLSTTHASASSRGQFASRIAALAKSPPAQAEGEALLHAASAPAVADISDAVLTRDGGSLTALQRELLGAGALLEQTNVRPIFAALAEQRRLTNAQNAALTRILQRLAGNRALALIRREGEQLRLHRARLRVVLSSLADTPGGASTPRSDSSIGEAERAFTVASPSLGGKSLAEATHELLTRRGALQYFAALPPLMLGMLFPPKQILSPQPPSAHRAKRAASTDGKAHLASLPSCTLQGDEQAAIRLTNFAAAVLLDDASGDTTESAVKKVAKLFGRFAGKAVRTIYYVINPAAAFSDGLEIGEEGISAVYNAAVECGVKELEIVPAKMTRPAGVRQQYSFIAKDTDGGSYGGVTPETLSIEGGHCYSNGDERECESEKVGGHIVVATFGGVRAEAVLNVIPGPLAHLTLSPETAAVKVGEQSPEYSVTGQDQFFNDILTPVTIGPANGEAALQISPDGQCIDLLRTCVPFTAGPHVVLAEDGDAAGSATLEVTSGLTITTRSLPNGTEGTQYSETLAATGGEQPYSWSVTSGSLPEGLTLDPTTGEISGTPTESGESTIEVTVTDKLGATAKAGYSLKVTTPASSPCVLLLGRVVDCHSTDPQVFLLIEPGEAESCTLEGSIDWGDGSPAQEIPETGGPESGELLAGIHTYSSPGTYVITTAITLLLGECSFIPAQYEFTLLA
jgi:hypothetical protein